MSAIDDLKLAVDNAVAEMQAAADFIKGHPASNNDQEMADLAHRLQSAADTLHGVDQSDASPNTSQDSVAGTASGEVPQP